MNKIYAGWQWCRSLAGFATKNDLQEMTKLIMKELDDLQAQVAQNTTIEGSAVELIQGLAAQIAAAGTDPAKLANLTSNLKSSADALAAAITANTPSAS